MKEIAKRLHENRQIELAKSILEANGYKVTQRLTETILTGNQRVPKTVELLVSGADEEIYELNSSEHTLKFRHDLDSETEAYLSKRGYIKDEYTRYQNRYYKTYSDDKNYRELELEVLISGSADRFESTMYANHHIKDPVNFDEYRQLLKRYDIELVKIYDYEKDTILTKDGKNKLSGESASTNDNTTSTSKNSNADHEDFVEYMGGKYAKDLKRNAGYVVYDRHGKYIGYADDSEEAKMMIQYAR